MPEKKRYKKITEEDISALTEILKEVTVTQSGMLRVNVHLILNKRLDKDVQNISQSLKEISERLKVIIEILQQKEIEVNT